MNCIVSESPIQLWSDLHLENPNCDVDGIKRAQKQAENMGASIICVGDILDLWYVRRKSLSNESIEILKWIQERLIVAVPGNHDSPTVSDHIFEPQYYPFTQLEIDSRLWYLEHGHLLGKWAFLFKILDEWDNKKWFRKISRFIVQQEKILRIGSKTNDPNFKYCAVDKAKLKGSTVVVVGHTHKEEIFRDVTGETEVTYVNPGSAIKKMTYAIYENGDFSLRRA